MKQIINDFINSIDTKLYSRIRASKGDAECRRYLKEHLQKQLTIPNVAGRSEQLKCHHQYVNAGTLQGDAMKKCLKCGDYVKAL